VMLSNLPPGLPLVSNPLTPLYHMATPRLGQQALSNLEVKGTLLPRGTYTHNEGTGEWDEQPAQKGDLTVNWVHDGVPGSLIINWELESDTAFVVVAANCMNGARNCETQVQEVPTSLSALLLVGGKEAADLTVRASYYDSSCGYLTYEPTSLSVQGAFGQETAVALDADFSVTKDSRSSLDTAASSLLLTAEAGHDHASLHWTWDVSGLIARNDHCFVVGAERIHGGNLSLGASSTVANKEAGFDFHVTATDVEQNEEGIPHAAQIEGHIEVDGERAVDFTGRLDDENADGVPGENVMLTFSDGTITLEAFLREQMMQMAVRTLGSHLQR
jgi:hypothetical protein